MCELKDIENEVNEARASVDRMNEKEADIEDVCV